MVSFKTQPQRTHDNGPKPFDDAKHPAYPGTRIPRRYEELNTSKQQDISHQKIIDIGGEILNKNTSVHKSEIDEAIVKVEKALWAEAKRQQSEAIEDAKKDAANEQEKAIRKLKKEHERTLKEEIMKVENRLKEHEHEELRKAAIESNRALREAVRQAEDEAEKKRILMVEETRKQEQQLAKVELARVEREHKEKLEKIIQEKEEERAHAVLNMVTKMLAEKDKAVERARAEEAKKHKSVLEEIKKKQALERKKVECVISEHRGRIEALKEDLNHSKTHQTNLQNKLLSLHHSFHDYVEATSKNAGKQTAFLVPPLYDI